MRFEHPVLTTTDRVHSVRTTWPARGRWRIRHHVHAREPVRRIDASGLVAVARYRARRRYGADYGVRIDENDAIYTTERVVHPAVWPALANAVFAADLVHGPWIHLRSSIRHHGLASAGAVATVHATVIDRFQRRSGERAIVDVVIEVNGNLVATLEHEAIIALHLTELPGAQPAP